MAFEFDFQVEVNCITAVFSNEQLDDLLKPITPDRSWKEREESRAQRANPPTHSVWTWTACPRTMDCKSANQLTETLSGVFKTLQELSIENLPEVIVESLHVTIQIFGSGHSVWKVSPQLLKLMANFGITVYIEIYHGD
jgi:hypothetical protein